MKRTLLLLLIILPFFTFAQNFKIDSTTTQAKYEFVTEQPGTKILLFSKALNWVSNTYKNPTSVITQNDKELGQLFITGTFLNKSYFEGGTNHEADAIVKYDCRFYTKDNKYKVVISKIYFDEIQLKQSTLKLLESRPDHFLHNSILKADQYFLNLIADIKDYMSKNAEAEF